MGGRILVGDKVRLRAYSKDDLEKVLEYLNDPEVQLMLNGGFPFPITRENEEKFLEKIDSRSTTEYAFAVEDCETGEYLGGCGVHDIDPKNRRCNIGLFLGAEHCDKGYGTDLMRTLVDFCFREMNLHKVLLRVFGFNSRARHVYEKIGFQTEGRLRSHVWRDGAWHDEFIMGLLSNEWDLEGRCVIS